MDKNLQTQKGFTIFIAVIVSSLLLLVTLAISNIALKETILSSAGKESEMAFYAADSGIECALFWDYQNPNPSSTEPQGDRSAFLSPLQAIQCGSVSMPVTYQSPATGVGFDPATYPGFDVLNPDSPSKPLCSGSPMQSVFTATFDDQTCAIVTVRKCYINATDQIPKTTIESRGQSSCNNPTNPRRFERAIRVIYP